MDDEKKCLQGLAFADYATYRGRIAQRHPGTLEWIPEQPIYQQWVSKQSTSSLLWISGGPGCGKTVISAYLLTQLEKRVDSRVAYFFCDDQEERQKSAPSLLRGIIHQLIMATPGLIKHAMRPHGAHGSKMLESLSILWDIFIAVATDPLCDGTYVILDALDECESNSRNDLLQRLSQYSPEADSNAPNTFLKVLITSRPYRDIDIQLLKHPKIRLKTEIEAANVEADITSFISHKVNELASMCKYGPELKEKVLAKLQTGADGMFLWVALVIEELFHTPIDSVSKTLDATPPTLYGLYARLLERLNGRNAEIVKRILMWVITAPRPLSVAELAIACSVNASHMSEASIGSALLTGFEHDIALCGLILKVQEGIVHLVHQSAKEFLLTQGLCDSAEAFRTSPVKANLELAVTCLTYLSFDEFADHPFRIQSSDIKTHSFLLKHQFLYFAAIFWHQFARDTDENHPLLWQAFSRLAKSKRGLSFAFRIASTEFQSDEEPIAIHPLYVSAQYGLCSFVQRLLEKRENVNARSGYYGSAIQVAAAGGHKSIVLLLLERGADANSRGGQNGTAIQAAAAGGHKSIVLLLKDRADVNASGWQYGSAIQAAAVGGNESIVQLLLRSGADANAPGGQYGSAIQAAAVGGCKSIVLLLLRSGADANAPGGQYGSAIQGAAAGVHESIVLLLLRYGADVNSPGGYYGRPIQAAAARGHESVVLLLLKNGADINSPGGYYGSPIQAAAARGHESGVLLLFKNGADVNASGGYYGSAIAAAAAGGDEAIVLLLILECGTDVNTPGGQYGSAIQAAAAGGHESIVLHLLKHGADVNVPGGYYGSAISAATVGGHKSIVLLLLKEDLSLNPLSRLMSNFNFVQHTSDIQYI